MSRSRNTRETFDHDRAPLMLISEAVDGVAHGQPSIPDTLYVSTHRQAALARAENLVTGTILSRW